MPSVIQRAQPVVSTEQTMQSAPGYGTLPYCHIQHPPAVLPYTAPPCRTAVYSTPAVRCHACLSARLSYLMGYYGHGNQFLLMPNPNWMSVREQMLQHQLFQERQQLEAWRASQAQPQPQPPISSSGLPI